MKIVADFQIPYVHQAFSEFGDVIMQEGRAINPQLVRNADILLVRSVTRVNAELLSTSKVSFVASATSGVDHVDVDYLQQAGIAFAHAPGCNARAVVEYVLSSLFVLAGHNQFRLQDKVMGIIGCGQVGSRLAQALSTLGVRCLLNDPPLREAAVGGPYSDLQDVLKADIISLHVPLTATGKYPTRHLVNEHFLSKLKSGAILINTSRGGVVDEGALKKHLRQRNFPLVLDVWEDEPVINRELLAAVAIGTPHIAGYSLDARMRATAMIYRRLCEHLHLSGSWSPATELANLPGRDVKIEAGIDILDGLEMAVLSHYDVRSDAAALHQSLNMETQAAGRYFDELRRSYPVRREFPATTVSLSAVDTPLAGILDQLGFRVAGH